MNLGYYFMTIVVEKMIVQNLLFELNGFLVKQLSLALDQKYYLIESLT